MQEINDRPSTYMSNEFVSLLESLRLKKRDETNLITKVHAPDHRTHPESKIGWGETRDQCQSFGNGKDQH